MFLLSKEEVKLLRSLCLTAPDGLPFNQLGISEDLYLRLIGLGFLVEEGAVVIPKEKLGFAKIIHSGPVRVSAAGKAVVEYHSSANTYRRFNEIRAWVTLAIAVLSFFLSVYVNFI